METNRYHTLVYMNKKIYFMGLSPMQFFAGFFISLILCLVFLPLGICSFLVLGYIGNKIRIKQQEGEADYVQASLHFSGLKRYYEDQHQVLSLLIKSNKP